MNSTLGSPLFPTDPVEYLLKVPQVQVSRDQNNSRATWVHANIHVLYCHPPNVPLSSILFPFLTATGGCEKNHRLPGQSTQRNNLPSILCHSLSPVAACTELCSGPHAVGECFKLWGLSELTYMGALGKKIVDADHSMHKFKQNGGKTASGHTKSKI